METLLALDLVEQLCSQHEKCGGTSCRDYIEISEDVYIWTASLVLLNHLRSDPQVSIRGKRVLELGSGLGHLAVGLASLGAHVTATELSGPVLHRLEESVQAQVDLSTARSGEALLGSIECLPCSWGREGYNDSPLSSLDRQPFDIIIMAESIYKESLYEPLLETLTLVTATRGGTWKGSVWAAMVPRPFAYLFFAHLHDLQLFDVTEVTPMSLLGVEEVVMHQITRK